MNARYAVDLDDLARVISVMSACEEALDRLTAQLEQRVADLNLDWRGEASTAHQLAQAEWRRGLSEMRAALTEFRSHAHRAHGNYAQAAETNALMWRRTR